MQEKRVVEKQCEYQRALLELQEKLKITLNQVCGCKIIQIQMCQGFSFELGLVKSSIRIARLGSRLTLGPGVGEEG